jgi:hypothetical protein
MAAACSLPNSLTQRPYMDINALDLLFEKRVKPMNCDENKELHQSIPDRIVECIV